MSNEWRRKTGDKPCFALVMQAAYRSALELGLEADDLFRGSGLDESVLQDPYKVIGRHQALTFYQNLVEIGPPGIGLDVGLATTLNERGSHGHMLVAVDTMQDAIELGQEFYELIYLHVGWATRLENNRFCHGFTEDSPLEGARQFCMDRALSIMQVGAEYFSGGELRPLLVTLDRPAPAYATRYEEIFQCPIRFSRDNVEIHYDSEALGYIISSHDEQVLRVMKDLCRNLLGKLHGRQDFVAEVRRAIHLKPGKFPNIEQVADRLGCAPRTLRRRLQQDQENFQKILDEERRAVACDYLRDYNLSIQKVANRCGFSDAQNFAQAFRRWSGMSPSEYRNREKSR